ncbi:hypothetical protein IKF04_00465 [Candidatus Saccharibacteria bacterium]|nr:hypothetical protein [Candidatus Saccharibacteria bacterium]
MKKSIIATGAASLALAAMPVVGVFAAANGTVTDTLTVNIPPSCTITNQINPQGPADGTAPALANSYTVIMKNGQVRSDIGGASDATTAGTTDNSIDVSCNTPSGSEADEAGWKLTAIGAGTAGYEDKLHGTAGDISTGTGVTGSDSQWAFKVVKGEGDNYSYTSPYAGGFAEVPSTDDGEMELINGRGNASGAFTMTYQVYISKTQTTGTYTGAVKYTLYNPAS